MHTPLPHPLSTLSRRSPDGEQDGWIAVAALDPLLTPCVSSDTDARGGVFAFAHQQQRYHLRGRDVGFVRFRQVAFKVSLVAWVPP